MTRASLVLVALVGGCGSSLTADQACTHEAQARCSQLMTCSPADFQRRWPDLDTCETREKLACSDGLAAPGTAATPKTADACATALAAQTCADFLNDVPPPEACLTQSGATADGGACAFASQCKSGFCAIASDALCGTCQEIPAAGASCTTNGCGQAMSCVAASLQCEAPVALGGACSKTQPCASGLACVGATTTTTGTCQTQVTSLGAFCDHTLKTAPNCDPNAGLTCDSTSSMCTTEPIVPAPAPCGTIQGIDNACAGGATCYGSATTMTCVAPAADGAACDTVNGPDCLTPAKCVSPTTGGTTGTCQLPGSMACS